MKNLTNCLYCSGDFVVKEVECNSCATQIRGSFSLNRFHMFSAEDLFFIEIFLKNEGNIKLVEKDLNISYPTVKSHLRSIIKTLGYQTSNGESKSTEKRSGILKDLSEGKIDVKAAVKNLKGIK